MKSCAYNDAGEPVQCGYFLFGSEASGWRMIRRVRVEYGRRQCARGVWRERFNENCELIGFRLLSPEERAGDIDLLTMPGSTATLKQPEMEAVAGLRGKSRTAHLCEDKKLERRQPDDFVERTENKFRVYPYVGARAGDILRAWPR